MSDVLDRMRERNRKELTLPTGLKVTLRRPSMRDAILAGNVPLPVLAKLDPSGAKTEEMTTEDLRHMAHVNDELVRRAVIAIDGESVDMAEVEDLSDVFSDQERDAIVAWVSGSDAEGNA